MKGIYAKVFFLVVLSALITSCSSGTAIVTGTKRTQISSNEVTLYFSAPKNYEVIALVEASDDTGWTPEGSLKNAIEELKNQAAKLGANGVLLGDTSTINSTVMGAPWITKTASAQAIHVFQGEVQAPASVSRRQPVPPLSTPSQPPKRKWKKPVQ